jgi:hypothetical protein
VNLLWRYKDSVPNHHLLSKQSNQEYRNFKTHKNKVFTSQTQDHKSLTTRREYLQHMLQTESLNCWPKICEQMEKHDRKKDQEICLDNSQICKCITRLFSLWNNTQPQTLRKCMWCSVIMLNNEKASYFQVQKPTLFLRLLIKNPIVLLINSTDWIYVENSLAIAEKIYRV